MRLRFFWNDYGIFVYCTGFIVALLTMAFALDCSACQHVCERNGDEADYTLSGCWCADEQGLYNPKDSREDRGGRR